MTVKEKIDEAFELGPDELKEVLPPILDELDENVLDLLENDPEILPRLFKKMDELDIAEMAKDSPELVDKFQEFLWTTTEELIRQDDDIRERIKEDVVVNFQATDSPMEGHLIVDSKDSTIRGGPNRSNNADIVITADSNTLIDLLTGEIDPVQGFMTDQYDMDGPMSKGVKLIPILNGMADKYTSI